jgi:hypothetical protein
MDVFLLLTLSGEPPFSYRQPLLEQVKAAAPGWVALDVDSFSEENLVAYAARLVREAARIAAVFQCSQPDVPLGACQRVLEEILQINKPADIFLLGSHRRLEAIFRARPHFSWHQADTPAQMQEQLREFFNQSLQEPE